MNKKLLLIEDDKAQQLVWKQVFTYMGGFDVTIAKDGLDGLKKLSDQFKIIVLDISMPGLDGIGFLHEFYKNDKYEKFREIPITVLTVWLDDEKVKKTMEEYRQVTFISKEADRKKVVHRVNKLIKL